MPVLLQSYRPRTGGPVGISNTDGESSIKMCQVGDLKFWASPGNGLCCPFLGETTNTIWVRSRNCGCFGTWFCYQLIAKPGNKTATVSRPDPYLMIWNLGFTWPWAVWGQRKQAFHCLLLGEAINSIWWPEFRHHLTEGSVRLKFELWCKVSLAPKIAE